MPDRELPPARSQPCEMRARGTASTASIAASLCSVYPLDAELSPELQAALTALSDHTDAVHASRLDCSPC